ncbi:MAG: SRPBCC family protein [Opitutae bacterium]|nr:SRPBCC family protein [Opitutae bacterium]
METSLAPTPVAQRELVLQRTLHASRENLFRCWTDPQLITQWFTPPPWKTVHAEMDVRSGGRSCITMRAPDGQEFPNRGIYLEVVPNAKIVFTDAFVGAWEPSEKAFMVGTIAFEDAGDGRTLYTARVQHWSVADREAHEKMGFHEGWGLATQQLEALAQKI